MQKHSERNTGRPALHFMKGALERMKHIKKQTLKLFDLVCASTHSVWSRYKLVVIFFVCGAVIVTFFYVCLPFREIMLEIQPGDTPIKIAAILKNEKIISSKNLFVILTKFTGTEKKFKTGLYKLNNRMPEIKIIFDIVRGRSHKFKITFPEGFTSYEMAELLDKNGICKAENFLNSVHSAGLEGYLFPNTYFFEVNTPAETVIKSLTAEFEKIFTKNMLARADELKMSKKDIVILASIIEREAKNPQERPIISSVFHNRLRRRWKLASCATVIYVLNRRGIYRKKLFYKDTEIDSPYNTYIHSGLPPGPICNPGLASIKAALYPAETDLLFFIADGNGSHRFSSDYREHNLKKRQRSQ